MVLDIFDLTPSGSYKNLNLLRNYIIGKTIYYFGPFWEEIGCPIKVGGKVG